MTPLDVEARALQSPQNGDSSSPNLAILYQGLLTGIVRLNSGRQQITDAESFRRKTKVALQQVERDGVAAGYDNGDIRDTHYAVVAFLDAVILNSNDPVRAEWERRPLQEELFGKTDAGVVFFEKLDHFSARRDSSQLADILEVYALCLLLGFQGRYSGILRGELDGIIERTRKRIERIRGRHASLSPNGGLAQAPKPQAPARVPTPGRNLVIILIAVVAFTVLLFLILKLNLVWAGGRLASDLI